MHSAKFDNLHDYDQYVPGYTVNLAQRSQLLQQLRLLKAP